MTALALAPEATYVEPLVGWRVWRILPFETLQGEKSYRLCAAGAHGVPNVWEPRAASTAVCSEFRSTHEAPWPDCDCGFYAYRNREDALKHMKSVPRIAARLSQTVFTRALRADAAYAQDAHRVE